MKSYIQYYTLILVTGMMGACKKDNGKDATNPPVILPQEQITTVVLTGYNQQHPDDPAYQFNIQWEDLDGTGGAVPVIDSLLADTGIQYEVSVLLLDKTKSPWDTISNEVEEEKDHHQFFYTPGAGLAGKMTITIQDMDDNTPPLPVGLKFVVDTRTTSGYTLPVTGSLKVVLSHYDGIPKTTAPSPESDIDIQFPVRLK